MDSIKISNFKPHRKHTLRAFFAITLQPEGLIIHDVQLHELNGRQWVGFPARPYIKDGVQVYSRIIEFADRQGADRFTAAILGAIEEGGYATC